jgi:hypothetical protein
VSRNRRKFHPVIGFHGPKSEAAREYTAMALATLAEIAKKGEIEFGEMTEAEIAASASARPSSKTTTDEVVQHASTLGAVYLRQSTLWLLPPRRNRSAVDTDHEDTAADDRNARRTGIRRGSCYSQRVHCLLRNILDRCGESQCKWKARKIQARFGVPRKQDLINCREIP